MHFRKIQLLQSLQKKAMLTAVLLLSLTLLLTAGCRNQPDDELIEITDHDGGVEVVDITASHEQGFIFFPEFTRIAGDFASLSNFVHSNGSLYFTSMVVLDELSSVEGIYRTDIDGTNITKLTGYSPAIPADDEFGSTSVLDMHVNDDGTLWILERSHFVRIDIPDAFTRPIWELYEYWEDLGSVEKLRKLDSTGAEIKYIDIAALLDENYSFESFQKDSDGNFYIVANLQGTLRIYVLSENGSVQFTLDAFSRDSTLVPMQSGVAVVGQVSAGMPLSLTKIDFASESWGESTPLPSDTFRVYPNIAGFDVLLTNGISLYGLDTESEEVFELLNWRDNDINGNDIRFATMLHDGSLLCIETRFLPAGGDIVEMAVFTRKHYSDLPQFITLTLAAFSLSQDLQAAVRLFNRSNPTYKIQIVEYFDPYSGDFYSGLERLSLEIMTGNVPDIFDMAGLPLEVFAARGLLIDLYQLIDSDPELTRNDFMQGVLRAAEIRGGLYHAFPLFSIDTIVGNPSVLGAETSWSVDEFIAVMEANPQADRPLGAMMRREVFLQTVASLYIDGLIDWEAGTTHFYRDSFVRLLEFAGTFGAQYDFSAPHEPALIASGRQIMSMSGSPLSFASFGDYLIYRAIYGGELIIKGLPTNGASGNVMSIESGIAITAATENVDGAWQFVRTFLTEQWQLENTWRDSGFLTNRAAFEARAEAEVAPRRFSSRIGWGDGWEFELDDTTAEDVELILSIIDSLAGTSGMDISLMNIILEGANDFWNDRNSAEEAARIIQSRASIFVAERAG